MRLRESLRPGGAIGVFVAFLAAVLLTAYGVTEEVPLGTVRGVAVMAEGGKPVSNAEVHYENYVLSSGLEGLVTYRTVTDEDGRFQFRNVPQGYAVLRVYAPGYSAETVVDVGKETKYEKVALVWKGDDLQIATNQPVFSPNEVPQIVINGTTRREDVAIKVFAFGEGEVFEKRDVYSLARNIAYSRYDNEIKPEDQPKPLHDISHPLHSRDIQGKFAEVVDLPQLAEGIYIVRASVDGIDQHLWLNVSRLGLVAKASPSGAMAYVVDIASGKPMSGIDVSLVGANSRVELGKTDAEGVVKRAGGPPANDSYVMVASQGSSRAFAMFYWWQDSDGSVSATHITTDRTVYKPGDTVHYKGFVRIPDSDGFHLPSFRNVRVTVFDPDGTELLVETRPVNAMGGFDGSFETMYELTGSYQLQVEIDGQMLSEWIPVSAYRKPEFRITVTPDQPYFVQGQAARFKVKAEYYTGEPLVGAELSAWASRADVWRWSPFDDEEYDYYAEEEGFDYTYGGEYLGAFSARTDESGEAVIVVPTSAKANDDEDWWYGERDQVYSLSVSGQDASGRYFEGRGQVDVVRSEVDLSVAFADYVVAPGRPVDVRIRATSHATGAALSGLSVLVEFGQRKWDYRRTRDIKETERRVQLDENGEATISVSPKEVGDYFVRVVARDSARRESVDRDYVWVYRSGASLGAPAPKMQVVLDKKQYAVGETATAVVRTDKPGGSALVTVEARDVIWSKIVPLDEETNTVQIPVTKAFRPNASVQVSYIREKSYASASRTIVVDMGDDRLDVSVRPSKEVTLPGSSVSYTVSTRNAQGEPVSADVALSVVDEGVYAIREDRSDPLQSFFPRRWTTVVTSYSFPEVYLDGDDKSPMDMDVRTDFKDTAHWAPSVVTGDDGTATVTVDLPDNLTSWRATATAVSASAMAGKGRADVIARKPVMVRLSLPDFMVQDETQIVGATVSNETGRNQRFEVRLSADGIGIEGSSVQRVEVENGKSGRVSWTLRAREPGSVRVQITAVAPGTGQSDALAQTFEIKANGPTLHAYAAGDTTDSAKFQMGVDPGAVTGELTVRLSPSILASVVGSLDSLVDYPYGCVEQTMSRFMPAVVVASYLRETGDRRPELEAKIADVSKQSQARLRSMQNPNGGFGWWSHDEGDPDMTAYVLEGLYHAERAGMEIDVHLRDRALEWSKEAIKNWSRSNWWRESSARLAYALALHDVSYSAWSSALPDPKAVSDPTELAYIVLALSAAKGDVPANVARFKDQAYRKLIESATESDTAMSWSNEYWYEPTAVALQAVMKMEPRSERPVRVLRYLGRNKRGQYWTSTRDTAQIVVAAIEFLRANPVSKNRFTATVLVNGNAARTIEFDPTSTSRESSLSLPLSELKEGANEVEIQISGHGRVYFSAELEQTVYQPKFAATDSGHGLKIKREYFRMETKRLEDGTLQQVPSNRPVTTARAGEVLHCRLTITSDRERKYVMVMDPALSNAVALDRGKVDEWYYWWSDQSFFADHTAVFMTWLEKGESVVEYAVRAEAVGESVALPATVAMMYQPDVRGSSATARLEVRK